VDDFDPAFCFYDDPDVPENEDADKYSPILRRIHQALWSKALPTGAMLDLRADQYGLSVTNPTELGNLRLSSDTIASSHRNYRRRGIDALWNSLPVEDRLRYDRAFYTVGGFIVFPCHANSINQRRGTDGRIDDRFDLTLECIRRYYEGVTDPKQNPLGDVLRIDSTFFDLFGTGIDGFTHYVDFFHLGDLVADGRIRWFDESTGDSWKFADSPLPKTVDDYKRYLNSVLRFVHDRGDRIAGALGGSK